MAASTPSTGPRNTILHQSKEGHDIYSLRNAENSCPHLLPLLHTLDPGFTFLDIGCGPGHITLDLAVRFPHAHFTAVDWGETSLAAARELATQRGVTNVNLVVADIMNQAPSQFGVFDVVHCHQVVTHQQEPVRLLQIMKQLAKPHGGIVAAREVDFLDGILWYPSFPSPEDDVLRDFFRVVTKMLTVQGADPTTGRKLLSFALKAGWAREQITASSSNWCYATSEERRLFCQGLQAWGGKGTSFMATATAEGYSAERMDQLGPALQTIIDAEDGWFSWMSGEIVCKN